MKPTVQETSEAERPVMSIKALTKEVDAIMAEADALNMKRPTQARAEEMALRNLSEIEGGEAARNSSGRFNSAASLVRTSNPTAWLLKLAPMWGEEHEIPISYEIFKKLREDSALSVELRP